jgi:hypothetical protein
MLKGKKKTPKNNKRGEFALPGIKPHKNIKAIGY